MTLPMTGGQVAGRQISESMLISGTLPDTARTANLVGGLCTSALALDTVHISGVCLERQSGTFSPTSGDSLMATTEIPWLSSWSQYWAMPAPISCCAAGPPAGCLTVARPGQSLVITTSGRMLVVRSCITAAPQVWQE